jgi:hypothetical protein
MNHWNYRIVRWNHKGNPPCTTYGIHEAFYDEKNKIWGITEKPVAVDGDSPKDLKEGLKWMSSALKKPILDYDKIPEKGARGPGPSKEEKRDRKKGKK